MSGVNFNLTDNVVVTNGGSLGAGQSLFSGKVGNDLQFNSLDVGATGLTVSTTANVVTVDLAGDLSALAGLASTAGNFIVGSAAGWTVEAGATARDSIGLGVLSNPTFNNMIVSGNLTVNGTTTTVNSQSLLVTDPLFEIGSGNTTTDLVDLGFFADYSTDGVNVLHSGFFRDSTDGKWKLFQDSTQAIGSTSMVDTAAAGYTASTLVANIEGTITDISNHNLGELLDVNAVAPTNGEALVWDSLTSKWIPGAAIPSTFVHSSLTGLLVDDHTQYSLLAGRVGGQVLSGGSDASTNLTLQSTSNVSKGKIIIGSTSAYDEANNRLGINTTTPTATIDVVGDIVASGNVSFGGGMSVGRTATAANITTTANDYIIAVTDTLVGRVVTLVSAATAGAGKVQIIKDESGGAMTNNIIVTPSGLETIDGVSSISLTANYSVLRIYSDGANWFSY